MLFGAFFDDSFVIASTLQPIRIVYFSLGYLIFIWDSIPVKYMDQCNRRPSFACKDGKSGYIVMLRARMFRSLIPVLTRGQVKERNIRARNITI